MGVNMAKHASGDTTNMSKELEINVNLIVSCHRLQLKDDQYLHHNLSTTDVIDAIVMMNSCKYIQTNYIYNTKNRICLTLKDETDIILALSDCGKYIGKPTRASGMGLWFYLLDDNNNGYHPFTKFIVD